MFIKMLILVFICFSYQAKAQNMTNSVRDADGNEYGTILIGLQEWMAENLRTTSYKDGTAIINISDKTEWVRTELPAYSWYENNPSNKEIYGGLYNWHAVFTGKLCPEGWRVPRTIDWEILFDYLAGEHPITEALKQSGFGVSFGGYRYGYYWGSGLFREQSVNGYWWSITKATDTHAWARTLSNQNSKVYNSYFELNNGFSVRCIKCKDQIVKDIDGNVYSTVIIGDQEWLTENLKTTLYNDGSPIPNITDAIEWHNINTPAFVWYNNDISNKDVYGALYNGYVLENSENLCPSGWHVASDDDWKLLEMYLGMTVEQVDGTVWRGTDEGGKLKESGTEKWAIPNKGAFNTSGLSIIPSGRRDSSGRFYDLSTGSTIWTSTVTTISSACYRHFASTNAMIGRNPLGDRKFGLAVRCIRDRK